VDSLGGRIEIDSKVNHGTTFRVFLTAHSATAPKKKRGTSKENEARIHTNR
jgi:hypothetical protein